MAEAPSATSASAASSSTAASRGPAEDVEDDGNWACPACTFNNGEKALTCDVCGFQNPFAMSGGPVWEWFTEEFWAPYDADASAQLEEALKAGQATVQLNAGWFAGHAGYEVRFRTTAGGAAPEYRGAASEHMQINTQTQTQRRVRRTEPVKRPPKKAKPLDERLSRQLPRGS